MRKSWRLISAGTLCCLFLLASGIVALAQDQASKPDYSWLNGKWRGPAPAVGGSTELNLKVVSDNQVEGFEVFQRNIGGGRKDVRSPISGAVNGDKVELSISRTQAQIKLQLVHTEDSLKGKFRGEEVVYKKSP